MRSNATALRAGWLALVMVLAIWLLMGATCGDDDDSDRRPSGDDDDDDDFDSSGLHIVQKGGTQICDPAGVRVVFTVIEDGSPVPNLRDRDFEVINDETDEPFQSEGGSSAFIEANNDFEFYSILVLDLSFSIVENDRLDDVLDGAHRFVKAMIVDQSSSAFKHNIAIYVFGSTAESELVQDFTKDAAELYATIEDLRSDPGRGSTNLYGAFIEGVDLLQNKGDSDLVVRSLVILSDGTHETGDEESMRRQALDKLDVSDVISYAIGIKGDYSEDRLKELASSSRNFFLVEESSELVDAFEHIAELVEDWSISNYVIGVCSPLEGPDRSLTIVVENDGKEASLTVPYDATGFNLTGCNPMDVALGEGCSGGDDDDDTGGDDDDDDTSDPTPFVVSYSPEDEAEQLPIGTQVVIEFSRAMDRTATEGAFSVDGESGTITWNGSSTTMTFHPSGGAFPDGEEFTATLTTDAEAENGHNLDQALTIEFATTDLWTFMYDSVTHANDAGNAVAVDADFNAYFTGSAYRSGNEDDIFIAKVDAHGDYQWGWLIGGSDEAEDYGFGIDVRDDGTNATAGLLDSSLEGNNLYVITHTSGGVEIFSYSYNRYVILPETEVGRGAAIDSNGYIYACGSAYNRDTSTNIIVFKFTPSGSRTWSDEVDVEDDTDIAYDCAVDESDNLFVAGSVRIASGENAWIRKYSSAGYTQWTDTYNGTGSGTDRYEQVAADGDGNVIVAGWEYHGSTQGTNLLTRKFDTAGDLIWALSEDVVTGANDYGKGVAIDSLGNVFVAGNSYHDNQYDAWVRKYDPDGTLLWQHDVEETGSSERTGKIDVDSAGHVYVSGTVSTPGQGYNIWVRKIDSGGGYVE